MVIICDTDGIGALVAITVPGGAYDHFNYGSATTTETFL